MAAGNQYTNDDEAAHGLAIEVKNSITSATFSFYEVGIYAQVYFAAFFVRNYTSLLNINFYQSFIFIQHRLAVLSHTVNGGVDGYSSNQFTEKYVSLTDTWSNGNKEKGKYFSITKSDWFYSFRKSNFSAQVTRTNYSFISSAPLNTEKPSVTVEINRVPTVTIKHTRTGFKTYGNAEEAFNGQSSSWADFPLCYREFNSEVKVHDAYKTLNAGLKENDFSEITENYDPISLKKNKAKEKFNGGPEDAKNFDTKAIETWVHDHLFDGERIGLNWMNLKNLKTLINEANRAFLLPDTKKNKLKSCIDLVPDEPMTWDKVQKFGGIHVETRPRGFQEFSFSPGGNTKISIGGGKEIVTGTRSVCYLGKIITGSEISSNIIECSWRLHIKNKTPLIELDLVDNEFSKAEEVYFDSFNSSRRRKTGQEFGTAEISFERNFRLTLIKPVDDSGIVSQKINNPLNAENLEIKARALIQFSEEDSQDQKSKGKIEISAPTISLQGAVPKNEVGQPLEPSEGLSINENKIEVISDNFVVSPKTENGPSKVTFASKEIDFGHGNVKWRGKKFAIGRFTDFLVLEED